MKYYYRVPSDSTNEADDRNRNSQSCDTKRFVTEEEVVSWFKDLYTTQAEKETEHATC